MFYDISSKKQTFQEKKEKPVIFADIHEKDSLIFPELIENKINLKISYLDIADYVIGNIAIERKTINDFVSSLYSKRLFEQLAKMQSYEERILILEGNMKDCFSKIDFNVFAGAILSIITDFKTGILYAKDYKESSKYLVSLANKQLKKKSSFSLHSKIPKTIKEQKHYILEAFPKIGKETSKKLLEKYSSLRKIFNSSEDELKSILKSRVKGFIGLLENEE